MHRTTILLGTLVTLFGAWTSAQAQCVPVRGPTGEVGTVCGDFRPLRLASAALGNPPLIWSSSRAELVPPPAYGWPRAVGRTIPIEAVIGRRVLPVTRLLQSVVYNNPESFPGAVEPGIVLMPLRPARRVVVRETYVRPLRTSEAMTGRTRLRRIKVIRVKD